MWQMIVAGREQRVGALGATGAQVVRRHASKRREVGSQSLNTVDEDDADARHLLGPLLDDLGDGGPSTNRRG